MQPHTPAPQAGAHWRGARLHPPLSGWARLRRRPGSSPGRPLTRCRAIMEKRAFRNCCERAYTRRVIQLVCMPASMLLGRGVQALMTVSQMWEAFVTYVGGFLTYVGGYSKKKQPLGGAVGHADHAGGALVAVARAHRHVLRRAPPLLQRSCPRAVLLRHAEDARQHLRVALRAETGHTSLPVSTCPHQP